MNKQKTFYQLEIINYKNKNKSVNSKKKIFKIKNRNV